MSLFTEDGTFRVEGLEVEAISHGRAQLRKLYEKALDELDPRLFIHSQIIDLGEKTADRPIIRRAVQRQVRYGAGRPGLLLGPVRKSWCQVEVRLPTLLPRQYRHGGIVKKDFHGAELQSRFANPVVRLSGTPFRTLTPVFPRRSLLRSARWFPPFLSARTLPLGK